MKLPVDRYFSNCVANNSAAGRQLLSTAQAETRLANDRVGLILLAIRPSPTSIAPMELTTVQLDDERRVIRLAGRMDIKGAGEIDLKFNELAGASKGLVAVDLSGVDFMASMGIRTLLMASKAQKSRGGKLVLAAPQETVDKALAASGISKIIPTYPSLDEALAALDQ